VDLDQELPKGVKAEVKLLEQIQIDEHGLDEREKFGFGVAPNVEIPVPKFGSDRLFFCGVIQPLDVERSYFLFRLYVWIRFRF